MNHGLSEGTLEAIRGVLACFPQVEKAVLYGSRAKGNFKPGSDIDLSLFGEDLNGRILARIDWALDDLLLPYKMDLSVFTDLRNPSLIDHIQRVGLTVYESTALVA